VFGYGIIAYFSACGFLGGYLSTRLLLARLLVEEEQNTDDLEQARNQGRKEGEAEGVKKGQTAALDQTMLELNKRDLERQEQETLTKASDSDKAALELAKQWQPKLPTTVADDPQKKRFGEKAELNARKLSAEVTAVSDENGELFEVMLKVESTRAEALIGPVKFFLHSTFKPDTVIVVPSGGVARLKLVAWGAFTVGVLCDGGNTSLELDLSELPTAPQKFRGR
jgi:hypothetical protein